MLRTAALSALITAVVSLPACATEFRVGDTVSVGLSEVIDDDLVVAARSALIAGRVKGDLFAAGQTVRVTGPVEGSVMVAGQSVRVTGHVAESAMAAGQSVDIAGDVSGSVRAAGQTVTLSGSAGRNAMAGGGSVVLTETARVARDFHGAATSIDLDGAIGRRASVAAQAASVRGRIGKQLYFEGEGLSLASSARVGGDLVYRSPKPAEIAQGAKIGGETRKLPPRIGAKPSRRRGPVVPALVFFLMVFVSGAVGLAAAPRLFRSAADAMVTRPWWNLLLGFLTLVVVPIAAIVVCFTVIGIPVALLSLVAWGAAILFSGVPVGVFLGRWLAAWVKGGSVSPYLGLFIGLLALTLLGFLPYLGTLTKFLTVLLGLGVYTRAFKGVLGEMRPRAPA